MERHGSKRDGEIHPAAPGDAPSGRTISRRQALGRMSVVATAGAVAWVVPEIMTAKPAAGASLSLAPDGGGDGPPGVTTPPGTISGGAPSGGASSMGASSGDPTSGSATASIPSRSLAFTGIDIQRDAEIGAALIAGGWAMHHWASRTPKAATDGRTGRTGAARSTDNPT